MAIEARFVHSLGSPGKHLRDIDHLQTEDESELDDLRAARGILLWTLLCGGTWTMIGLCLWLIAR